MLRESSNRLYLFAVMPTRESWCPVYAEGWLFFFNSLFKCSNLPPGMWLLLNRAPQLPVLEIRETREGTSGASGQGPSFGSRLKTQSDSQAPQRAPQQLSEPEQTHIAVHSRSVPLRPAGMLLPSGCQGHLENHYRFLQLPRGICAGVVLEGSAPRQSEYQLI